MNWASYGAFLALAALLTLLPGPDTAVAIKNTLQGGRRRGGWCLFGISTANVVQSTAAAAGLGVLIVTIEPLFLTVKYVGAAYLLFLAFGALRSARRGEYDDDTAVRVGSSSAIAGWRQGFVSNICNPKVIAFYLAVLPQFLGSDPSLAAIAIYAVSFPIIGTAYLGLVIFGVDRAREMFTRRRIRRTMDAVTGAALVAFGLRLATE
ncbi:LysE family translocator [Williamsia maris]|uniref:Threonine/homoserine/homoserine lactone efflux protein n=1 Tax=Williamsia maris TaxID=72806 RepID=A0ABT1H8G4_9NOCA|nr:LysE family translocator [Williamsia maris]MCP2174548.1 Threonine/homoserine/homoserine lactone efflux protein [Williamsia maris]